MTGSKTNRYWLPIVIFLIVAILAGSAVAWVRYRPAQPVEIFMPPAPETQGRIYIGGAVASPGFYPFSSADSLGDLIQAAGGIPDGANLDELQLHVPDREAVAGPQKIDINRAEVWLLEALPGIGETLAQRIEKYRRQNGPFLSTSQLLKVSGISTTTYERIKDLITVAE